MTGIRGWEGERTPTDAGGFDRRTLLKTAGAGIATALLGSAEARGATSASLTFEDQRSDGRTVVVSQVEAGQDCFLVVRGEDSKHGGGQHLTFEAGESAEDLTVELTKPLFESGTLSVSLYPDGGGQGIARDTAQITVERSGDRIEGLDPTLVEADADAGFNYPYFLYAPDRFEDDPTAPVLVEPTNTGTSTDDFERHREAARQTVERGTGRDVADGVPAPFLVPVFPRPRESPVDWTHYVHALDDTTMAIDGGKLERVDRQLLAMVEDARKRLSEHGYPVADGLIMNGFSASGNFVERFATLHPEEVTSVTAGGLNGMPVLPIAEAKGHTLDYPVGVADVEALTGEAFDLDAFCDVNRFLYMGGWDSSDTIPYGDAWTDDELRQIALDVYGRNMQEDRFPYSKAVYDEVEASSVFRMYEGVGHTPRPALGDLIEFHQRSIAGDDVESIRRDLGGNVPNLRAHVEYAPRAPTVGEQVAFDATRSAVWNRELVEFEWAFGDGETATGELATHAFETHGGHNVALAVTDDAGDVHQSVVQVVVSEGDIGDPTTTGADSTTSESGTRTTTDSADPTTGEESATSPESSSTPGGDGESDGGVPGFGVGSAVAALGGLSYALQRRLGGGDR